MMKRNFWIILIVMFYILCGVFVWEFNKAKLGEYANEVLQLVGSSQHQPAASRITGILKSVSNIEGVRNMSPDVCVEFRDIWESNKDFLAVLALGDKDGEPVCTADPEVILPLPTMSDRSYYKKVRESDSQVVGEYVISKTTGAPILPVAYPIKDIENNFIGFVVGGVRLTNVSQSQLDEALKNSQVEVQWVDRNGKVLAFYPSYSHELGDNVLGADLVNYILSGEIEPSFKTGLDGKKRMYISSKYGSPGNTMYLLVGVSPMRNLSGLISIGVVTTISMLIGIMVGHKFRSAPNDQSK